MGSKVFKHNSKKKTEAKTKQTTATSYFQWGIADDRALWCLVRRIDADMRVENFVRQYKTFSVGK